MIIRNQGYRFRYFTDREKILRDIARQLGILNPTQYIIENRHEELQARIREEDREQLLNVIIPQRMN